MDDHDQEVTVPAGVPDEPKCDCGGNHAAYVDDISPGAGHAVSCPVRIANPYRSSIQTKTPYGESLAQSWGPWNTAPHGQDRFSAGVPDVPGTQYPPGKEPRPDPVPDVAASYEEARPDGFSVATNPVPDVAADTEQVRIQLTWAPMKQNREWAMEALDRLEVLAAGEIEARAVAAEAERDEAMMVARYVKAVEARAERAEARLAEVLGPEAGL